MSNTANYMLKILSLIFTKILHEVNKRIEYNVIYSNIFPYKFRFISKNEKPKDNIIGLRNGTSDFLVFYQIFVHKEFLPVVNLFNEYNFKPRYIIDLGSNVGFSTLYFHSHFPNAKFATVEPFIDNFIQLKYNLRNIYTMNLNCAIWSADQNLSILSDFRDGADWSKRVNTEIDNRNLENIVSGISFRTLIDKVQFPEIDFLKIDIEGSEEILLFSDTFIEYIFSIKCMAIEIHDELVSRQKICDFLSNNNFNWFNSGELVVAHRFNN